MLKCSCREQYIRLNCTLVVYSIVSYTFNIASLHLNEWTGQAFMFFFLHNMRLTLPLLTRTPPVFTHTTANLLSEFPL